MTDDSHLKETETRAIERMMLALEATSDAIWEWEVATGEAYFSPRYYTMLGYKPGEFKPCFKSWESLVHPDDLQRARDLVFAHIERGEPFDIEFRLRTKPGGWRWVHGRGRIMERDEQGRPIRMVGTHADIHERKMMEERLKVKYQELETLYQLGTSVVFSVSSDEVIESAFDIIMRFFSPDLAILYGIEGDEIIYLKSRSALKASVTIQSEIFSVGQCLCGMSVSERSPIFSRNIHDDTRCPIDEYTNTVIQSFVALPLISRGQVVGALGIGAEEEQDFSRQSSFLESVASLIATGLANVQMHEELKAHAVELEKRVEERTTELTMANKTLEDNYIELRLAQETILTKQHALEKSEKLLSETGRTAKVGGWELELSTNRVIWTNEVYTIHEVDPDFEPNMEDALEFYPKESRRILEEAIRETMETGQGYSLELDFRTAKGKNLCIRTIGRGVFENDQLIRLHGTFQDVTERVLAERELRWQREAERTLADLTATLLTNTNIELISNQVLDAAQSVTISRYGYAGILEEDTGHLICHTMTRDIWTECDVPDKSIVFEKYCGLWGWVLHHERPLMSNTPA